MQQFIPDADLVQFKEPEYRPYPQTEGQGLIKGGIAFQPPQDRSTVAENAGPVPMKVHKQRLDMFLPPWTGTATTSEEPMKRNKKTRITTPKKPSDKTSSSSSSSSSSLSPSSSSFPSSSSSPNSAPEVEVEVRSDPNAVLATAHSDYSTTRVMGGRFGNNGEWIQTSAADAYRFFEDLEAVKQRCQNIDPYTGY